MGMRLACGCRLLYTLSPLATGLNNLFFFIGGGGGGGEGGYFSLRRQHVQKFV